MLRKLASLALGPLLAALFAPAVCVPAGAQETRAQSPAEPQTNVRVTIRLVKLDQGKRNVVKSYDLLVATGTTGSKLLSGSRVPIPNVKREPAEKGAGGEESTQYVYQNIGFSVEAKVWLVGDRKVKLLAEIEDSRLKERAGQPPVVETRQLSVNTLLPDGTPMEATRIEGDADPSGVVEVEARILR